ncbi:hypothetical protein A8F94_12820 [Bacillus sp. FJAT-27225]|uniref:hypothetical protein n=1 Tax=Bacillus sp. FJAT-27225 TaxID=1743144 RepID=UPI00080C34E6|nr:hypothetical protein A8F94_12820 [Bacillus sp. FJAT-27225]
MRGILYKFEEHVVVVHIEGTAKDFPRAIFPEKAVPGDVVEIKGDTVTILTDEPGSLIKEFEQLMGKVWEK